MEKHQFPKHIPSIGSIIQLDVNNGGKGFTDILEVQVTGRRCTNDTGYSIYISTPASVCVPDYLEYDDESKTWSAIFYKNGRQVSNIAIVVLSETQQ